VIETARQRHPTAASRLDDENLVKRDKGIRRPSCEVLRGISRHRAGRAPPEAPQTA
jgi:hypothetical protein